MANKWDSYAKTLKDAFASTNSDFVAWSKKKYPPDGFADQKNVLGDVLGSNKKQVAEWRDDNEFFRDWVRFRDSFLDLKKEIDSTFVDYSGYFDQLRQFNVDLNARRNALVERGGSLSTGDVVPPAPGSDTPPSPPKPPGLSDLQMFALVAIAGVVVGGAAAYYKKSKRGAASLAEFTPSQMRLLRMADQMESP
jgi:hypothetical protein